MRVLDYISNALLRSVPPTAAIAIAVLVWLPLATPFRGGTLIVALIATLALGRILLADFRIRRLAGKLEVPEGAALWARVEDGLAKLVHDRDQIAHRVPNRHGITGLPTRERLMRAMSTGPGVLGIIELTDFDRICAISPERSNLLLTTVAGRMQRMTGTSRTVAHVDRARFAIWFDGANEQLGKAEFDAIAYALQDRIECGDDHVIPVIRAHHMVCTRKTSDPEELLARCFAMLATSRCAIQADGGALDGSNEEMRRNFRLEQDLRDALAAGEFELCFQPFIDASRKRICGAEALIRWHHAELGLISPTVFIPIAEAAGLTEEIGQWVLNSACRAAHGWAAAGLQNVKVAVNVSAHQLNHGDLAGLVRRALMNNALPPGLLEVELTETAAAMDSAEARRLFDTLRALGVSISIDDFGAGYSSLSYLKKLNFDKLKIDREFVTRVDERHDSQAICQSIIALGRGLGIDVLAEGTERSEEVAWLQSRGCRLFQGYHFSAPLRETDFVALAKNQSGLMALLPAGPGEMRAQIAQRMAR